MRASNLTVDFSGSIVECYMNDSCLFVGDPTSSVLFENITIINPRGRPMVANGTKPFIEVNAQKTRVFNVAARSPATGNSFGSYVQVDDDQAFLLDGLDANLGYGVRCDASFCGSYVTAPGPFNVWSAVGWLKHLSISPQCSGNGIDRFAAPRSARRFSGSSRRRSAGSRTHAAPSMCRWWAAMSPFTMRLWDRRSCRRR